MNTVESIFGTSVEHARAALDALAFSLARARVQVDLSSGVAPYEALVRVVAEKFAISRDELLGYARPYHVVIARQCLYALLRRQGMTSTEVGKVIGRDHVTVLLGARKWHNAIETEQAMRARWEEILRLIEPKETTEDNK